MLSSGSHRCAQHSGVEGAGGGKSWCWADRVGPSAGPLHPNLCSAVRAWRGALRTGSPPAPVYLASALEELGAGALGLPETLGGLVCSLAAWCRAG